MSRLILLYLLSLTVRSLAFAAVAGLILLRSRRVHVRHATWTMVLCSVFLMPVIDTLLPSAMVPAVVPEVIVPLREFVVFPTHAVAPPLPVESVASVEPARDWWGVALVLTALVSSVLLFRLLLVLRQVLLIKKGSRPVLILAWDDLRTSSGSLLRRVSLRESGSVAVPLTIGFWRPALILPLRMGTLGSLEATCGSHARTDSHPALRLGNHHCCRSRKEFVLVQSAGLVA